MEVQSARVWVWMCTDLLGRLRELLHGDDAVPVLVQQLEGALFFFFFFQ